MWQVLLAAAIAGSGYLAKQLLLKNDTDPTNDSSRNCDLPTEITPSPVKNAEERSVFNDDTSSIFRFSSASSSSKNSRKKLSSVGGFKGNFERKFGSEKKCSGALMEDQRKIGKKFSVCLKKRRTSRNASAKCDSSDVKDKSSFGWGVGVGIMYMMSAGKAEIGRLNAAVDETAKIVQELKDEISKRKSSNKNRLNIKRNKSAMEDDNVKVCGFFKNDEGENASSILTEEPQMDELEAELETELLKIQGGTHEPSSFIKDPYSESNQCNGVMPFELDQKLSNLLIEQQESQIVDLESKLQRTNSKLSEKEAELQALKNCVKRLTECSLACPTGSDEDEEREGKADEEDIISDGKMVKGRSMVGIKRAMDFD